MRVSTLSTSKLFVRDVLAAVLPLLVAPAALLFWLTMVAWAAPASAGGVATRPAALEPSVAASTAVSEVLYLPSVMVVAPMETPATPAETPVTPVTPVVTPATPVVTPVTPVETPVTPVVTPVAPVNPQDRADSLRFYRQEYLTSAGTPFSWSGDRGACDPGDTTPAYRAAVLRRVNYFRAMAGVPDWITFSDAYNRKAQAAALMMAVNGKLDHAPTTDWVCYSVDGAEGASHSNLGSGMGWEQVDGYMRDAGASNYFAGHRRWILFASTREMGTGDVPAGDGQSGANALWVIDANAVSPRPATRYPYVAWPPPGFVPYPVMFARWSFSYPGADFSNATVMMASASGDVPVAVEAIKGGYGDNTLVWIPLGMADGEVWPTPQADTKYTVTVRNVVVGPVIWEFSYEVVVFDPEG